MPFVHYVEQSDDNLARMHRFLVGFYPNVTTLRSDLCYRKSVCRLSVTFVRPTQRGWNFRQYFFAVLYLSDPLASVQNFTKIVPGEPLRRGR